MKPLPAIAALLAVGVLAACSSTQQSPDVSAAIRTSLDQNGLKNVSVSQDRDKGVVTLSGHVAADAEKAQAESIATSAAGSEVVANQILVTPPGMESDAKQVNASLDDAITSNVKASLIQNNLGDGVSYRVAASVVTLTGHVNSQAKRTQVEKLAAAVPNVKQVINELQVTDQKATARGGGDR